jgi:SAM-dependent methyltransferase
VYVLTDVTGRLRRLARKYLSRENRRRLTRMAVWPPVGWVRFGNFRRLTPIDADFGNGRGLEIDRYYIEKFLAGQSADIHGRVLEIKHATYTRRFGGERVTQSDVLHPLPGNPDANVIADLTDADHLPSNVYDAIIFTQTLQVIYDIRAAVRTLYRIMKPGGVLLATASGMAKLSREDFEKWGEYWRFTSLSARNLFGEFFPPENVSVKAFGNVLAAISFLEGLAREDLRQAELDAFDPEFEILIAVRAIKPGTS